MLTVLPMALAWLADPSLAALASMGSDSNALVIGGGAVVAVLQGVVAFLFAGMYRDFKAAIRTLGEHNERLAVLEFRVSQLDHQPVHKPRRAAGG